MSDEIKSHGDPILDAKALCGVKPRTEQELTDSLLRLGWAPGVVASAIKIGTGIYFDRIEGLYAPKGTTKDALKALASE